MMALKITDCFLSDIQAIMKCNWSGHLTLWLADTDYDEFCLIFFLK